MSEIAKLIVATLFSFHQYLPNDAGTVKLFNDVREAQEMDIFPAAHHSCRYLMKVLIREGLGLSSKEDQSMAMEIFAGDGTLEWGLGQIEQPKYASRIEDASVDPTEVRQIVTALCSEDFSPFAFTPSQRQEVSDFINEKINILDEEKMHSLGAYRYFGSVEIFDRQGRVVGTIESQGKQWIKYHQIPRTLHAAILATEDNNFLNHDGIDPVGLARTVKQVMAGANSIGGGSTITMQLLKNLYFNDWPEAKDSPFQNRDLQKVLRKAREAYWALPFEKTHATNGDRIQAKRYILEIYFNLMEFGPRIQGIGQASKVYFNKDVSQLSFAEAAFLTSLLKAPSRYSSPSNYELTLSRRNKYVLPAMHELGFIPSKEELESAKAEPLPDWTRPVSLAVNDSFIYVRNHARQWISEARIFSGSTQAKEMKVETTIDKDLQEAVFRATKKVLDQHDEARNHLSRVGAAKNDRGRIASPQIEDVSDEDVESLKDIQEKLNNKFGKSIMVAAYLGYDQYEKAGRKLAEKSFIKSNSSYANYPSEVQEKIYRLLNQHAQYIGQFLLISLEEPNCGSLFEKIEDIIEQTDGTKANEVVVPSHPDCVSYISINSIDADTAVDIADAENSFRKSIISSTLMRLSQAPSRATMYPALYDGLNTTAPLVFEDGTRPTLVTSHMNYLKRMMSGQRDASGNQFLVGNVAWLSKNEVINPKHNVQLPLCTGQASDAPDCRAIPIPEPRPTEEEMANYKPEPLDESSTLGGLLSYDLADYNYTLEPPRLQAAVLVLDSNTGEVLANFGGYNPQLSDFDRSRLAVRQTGSTLKPWIYYMALNKNFNLYDIVENSFVSFDMGQGQPNYSPRGGGDDLPLYMGLTKSQNVATLGLVQDPRWGGAGWRNNLNELCAFFETIKIYEDAECYPSIMLGSQVVSFINLVRSYTFFANGKYIVEPQFVKRVWDAAGNEFYRHQPEVTEVPRMKESSVMDIRSTLVKASNEGTSRAIKNFAYDFTDKTGARALREKCFSNDSEQFCFGGKTGTTDSTKDTWFIGFSKNFVIGVWVGYDYPEPIIKPSSGASIALPVFQEIIKEGYEFLPEIEPVVANRIVDRSEFSSGGVVRAPLRFDSIQQPQQPQRREECFCDSQQVVNTMTMLFGDSEMQNCRCN